MSDLVIALEFAINTSTDTTVTYFAWLSVHSRAETRAAADITETYHIDWDNKQ